MDTQKIPGTSSIEFTALYFSRGHRKRSLCGGGEDLRAICAGHYGQVVDMRLRVYGCKNYSVLINPLCWNMMEERLVEVHRRRRLEKSTLR